MVQSVRVRNAAIIAAVGISVLVGLVVLLSAGRSGASPVKTPSQRFGVLTPATTPAVAQLPTEAQSWLGTLGDLPGSGSLSSVGLARVPGGGSVAVAQTGEDVCINNVQASSATCGSAAMGATGKLFVATPAGCGSYEVTGIVPDGVASLNVEASGSKVASIPVSENVYVATLPAVETVLTSADGSVTIEVPLGWYGRTGEAC